MHGFLLSLLFDVVAIVWMVVLIPLVFIGLIIGLIVSLVVLFYMIGFLNKSLMGFIWKDAVNDEWKSLTAQGFFLFLILLIIHAPIGIIFEISLAGLPSIVGFLVPVFLVYPFIDGYIGKGVGRNFAEDSLQSQGYHPRIERAERKDNASDDPMKECPYCKALFPYREDDISKHGLTHCRHCGASLIDPRYV